MSVDTTFKPLTPTALLGTAAAQIAADSSCAAGMTTFRVSSLLVARGYIAWGPKAAGLAAVAPTGTSATTVSVNTIGVPAGGTVYIEAPASSFFIASAAAAFEVTGGSGGNGG